MDKQIAGYKHGISTLNKELSIANRKITELEKVLTESQRERARVDDVVKEIWERCYKIWGRVPSTRATEPKEGSCQT